MSDSAPPEHNWEKYYVLKEGDVFVEAGAFWGRYGKIASMKVGDRGRVVLIEPSPENLAVIEDVVKYYDFHNVTVVRKAVWSEKRIQKFCVFGNPAGHRLSPVGCVETPVMDVEVDTVENILAELGIERVDLLGADVEGAEVEMVKGLSKNILHVAVAAYHGRSNPDAVMSILNVKGYRGIKYEEGVVYAHV